MDRNSGGPRYSLYNQERIYPLGENGNRGRGRSRHEEGVQRGGQRQVQMIAGGKPIELRRTVTPYVGQTLILIGVTVFLDYVAHKTSQWGLLSATALIWTSFAVYVVLFGMRYRVLWDQASVAMRASAGPERRIGFDEITEVKYELASVSGFLSQASRWILLSMDSTVEVLRQPPEQFAQCQPQCARWKRTQLQTAKAVNRCRGRASNERIVRRRQYLTFWPKHNQSPDREKKTALASTPLGSL